MTTDEQLSMFWRSMKGYDAKRVHDLFVEARKTSTAECYSVTTENTPADPEYLRVFGKNEE